MVAEIKLDDGAVRHGKMPTDDKEVASTAPSYFESLEI
jgi:hypothetical protein